MPKKLSLFQVLIVSFILSIFTFSKVYAEINNLVLTKLSVKEGMSQGTVFSMMQDNAGFMWFGTENGVNIYDGHTFRMLAGPNNAFVDASIDHLFQDNEGKIWISANGKLFSYNPQTNDYQIISTTIDGTQSQSAIDFIEGNDNDIWVLLAKSLGRVDKITGEYQQIVDFNSELVGTTWFTQLSLQEGVLFLSSRMGIFAVDITSSQWRKLPKINHETALSTVYDPKRAKIVYTVYTHQNNLYIGSADGLFMLDVGNIKAFIHRNTGLPKYQTLIENVAAEQGLLDGDKLYFATNKGLFTVAIGSNSAEFLFGFSDYLDDINNNSILSLLKDSSGSFWLGSNANGAYQWNPNRELIQNYRYKKNDPNSLSYNEIWGMLASKFNDNWLWVGTSNGLNLIDKNNHTVQRFVTQKNAKSIFTSSYIYSVDELNAEQLLLSTAQGVQLFDIGKGQYQALPFSDSVNELLGKKQFDIFKTHNFLWLANADGVFRVNLQTNAIDNIAIINDKFSKYARLRFLDYLPGSTTLLLASNDTLWQVDVEKNTLNSLYTHPNILPDEWVYFGGWAIDKHNVLWVAYPKKGLLGFSLDTFEKKYFYHKANSIIDNNIYGVMSDAEGDIWFSSHNGIYMLNSNTKHIRHFTVSDGLVATEYNYRSYAKFNHNLVYGSMEGISIFDPLKLKKVTNDKNFKVHVTDVTVLSRELNLPFIFEDNTVIDLNYDDVGVRVDFSTLLYNANKDDVFDFKLLGKNQLIYPQTSESHITFPNLSSGHHTLEIRAKSPYTGEFSSPLSLHFNVSYAPWRSPYAYSAYVLLVIVLFLFWYRYRKGQQQLLLNVHEQVKFREKRLQLALTGSNSEVWDWQAEDDLMFGKRISMELGYQNSVLFYHFEEHLALIHPDDKSNFLALWQLFITEVNLDESFICTYRLKAADGQWLWYKDLGKIVEVDESGKPIRVTGSYTNVTESKANEERAQYYGDAFKQTKDWVLIVNEKISRVTANRSMREVFGWANEVFDFSQTFLGVSADRQSFYKNLLSSLDVGQHWSGEELITAENKEKYHVVVNISAARNSVTKDKHYICVLTDISAQKSAEKELRFLANYDHLTGLPNRSLLLERVKHAMEHSNRHGKSIALFFIDLDRFKQVNDSLGHAFGDLLLTEITQRLTKVLRADDTVARIGGDEFVVLLESFKSNVHLGNIAQKIIDSIEEPFQLKKNIVSIGASIGIAMYPEDATDSDKLLRNADVAMYHAKQLGRNNFQFFTNEMNLKAKERLGKESKIKQALKNNEFINYYQPIINAHTGKAVGFELLMRWKIAGVVIEPSNFIPLAEELGLIISMTESAIDRGLRALKQWSVVRDNLYISVNLSPQHFAKDSLVPYIESLLLTHELPASAIRIEVTESAFIREPEKAIKTMCALAKLGIKLALDDFGTGFSSLSYLKQLPLDLIKIDRSFISGIGVNKADEAIVDTTLVLAKRLDMHCIAEGVENMSQLNYLVAQNCHYIQGYLYSKPVTANEIIKMLMINEAELMNDESFIKKDFFS